MVLYPHVSGELFKIMTGVSMVHVPYRGAAPALTDLISGQVQVMFDAVSSSIEYIRAGKLRALAMTTATRSDACRTCRPLVILCRATRPVRGAASARPKNTPMEIVDKLNKEINAALADPKIRARLADLGSVPMPLVPPISATSFPKILKSGARSFERLTSRRSEAAEALESRHSITSRWANPSTRPSHRSTGAPKTCLRQRDTTSGPRSGLHEDHRGMPLS